MNKPIAALGLAAVLLAAIGFSEARPVPPQPVETTAAGAELYRPHQAFSLKLGSKHAVGHFAAERGACALTVMLAETVDVDGRDRVTTAARFRAVLAAQAQTVIESEEAAATITCGAAAETVAVQTQAKAPARQSGL
ncbi:hypothetical protein [Prosthecodimorpha staleyi]|uniref:Uncharacterized protein n=1 Tax=Prosthecodimorpha staleyi TaxID=2840188 RepID=A0A947GDD1_9HYPH|nr:hypothetical protein [Prosthecodimorpha staleyi]MBT9288140.1 hypothetical protein [Prosthecodimorpha staleyi]